MTSEVVVMNRLGIALASDSAATVYVGGRPKIYHADKLFMLSNRYPVGAMVYNNSSLLGIPWETILKMFRAELGEKSFDSLAEYATALINFLSGNEHLFPQAVQRKFYLHLLTSLFKGLNTEIDRKILALARDDRDGSEDGPEVLKKTQAVVIAKELDKWRNERDMDATRFGRDIGKELVTHASADISNLIAKYFPGIGEDLVPSLYELSRLVVDKEKILWESLSGLVIAGYGTKEYFPVMQEYHLGEIFLGKLKYVCIETHKIDADTPSIIKPFADSEMVGTFLHGISPDFEFKMMEKIINALVESPDAIIDGIPGVGKKRKEAYKDKVRTVSIEAARAMLEELLSYRERKYRQPILQSIGFLPKNELAHVAASLVNLSSFQKRMSISEDETVGGPIDVAVISKGDGFVWIDRKHYFRAELNRHFFWNRGIDTTIVTGGTDETKKGTAS